MSIASPPSSPNMGLRPRPVAARPARLPWGWPELVILSQFVLPALMFIPGTSAIRMLLRVAAYAIPLLAFVATMTSGRRAPTRSMAVVSWMKFSAIWMGLSLFHPSSASTPVSALAQLILCVAIFSPVFWAPVTMTTVPRLNRLLGILFICCAASSVMGVLQFYYPERFNPPELRSSTKYGLDPYTYQTDDGRTIIRPCGLSDSPGGAASAGLYACIIGVAFALRPMAAWKRLACVFLSLAGMAAIFTTQVRSALVLAIVGQLAMVGILVIRRDFAKLSQLGMVAGLIFAASLSWAFRSGGAAVAERFSSLLEGSASEVYYENRGHFLDHMINYAVWQFPLGAGLGRWGMMYGYFGRGPALWAEIQLQGWVYDGGLPLLIGYGGAVVLAIFFAARVAIRVKDPQLSYAAMVIAVIAMITAAQCLSYPVFVSTLGVQFWLMIGALVGVVARLQTTTRPRPAVGPPRR